jgi:regulator of ribonuclease activity A
MRELDLGVKALGSNPRTSVKTGVGERDVTVEIGGGRFSPGMRLFSDEDGVVVTAGQDDQLLQNGKSGSRPS